jgi:insulysin
MEEAISAQVGCSRGAPLCRADSFEVENTCTVPILTPSLAQRSTSKLRLANGMSCYLVSDPSLKESGAALAVEKGSFSDPKNAGGIAHFTEHLLFMGTEKYPEHDTFQNTVAKHKGMTNACTMDESTCYYFTCGHAGFDEILDIWSWFFKAPTFNETCVKDELKAVDNEFTMGKSSDYWRQCHVMKLLANPKHPFSTFTFGNLDSLAHMPAKDVRAWYEANYSSDQMHLVVYSQQPLDVLREKVIDAFKDVPQRDVGDLSISEPMRNTQLDGHFIYCEGVQGQKTLSFEWELPRIFCNNKESRPETLIGHVLGHEGESSLLAQLKREGLASGLYSGGHDQGPNSHNFSITVVLTERGLANREMVMERVFQAIKDLANKGISKEIFDECQGLQKIEYQFQTPRDPEACLRQEAIQLRNEPLESFPLLSNIITAFDPELTQAYIEMLQPDSCQFLVQTPAEQAPEALDQKEPWMDTHFAVRALDPGLMEQLQKVEVHPAIRVPAANPFVPSDFALENDKTVDEGILLPDTVLDNDYGKVNFVADRRFALPKVNFIIDIYSPVMLEMSAKEQALCDLFTAYISQAWKGDIYDASLAGLYGNIGGINEGLRLNVDGFADRAEDLLERMLSELDKTCDSQQIFDLVHERLKSGYENFYKGRAYTIARENMDYLRSKGGSTHKQRLEALQELSLEDLQCFQRTLAESRRTEATLFGNLSKKQALSIGNKLLDGSWRAAFERPEDASQMIIDLPAGSKISSVDHLENENNVAILSFAHGTTDLSTQAAFKVLNKMLSSPFFDDLRTARQTGYVAASFGEMREEDTFTSFMVMSPSHDPKTLFGYYRNFIATWLETVEDQKELFESIRENMIYSLKKGPSTPSEMAGKAHALAFKKHDLLRHDRSIEALEALDFETFVTITRRLLDEAQNGCIEASVYGTNHMEVAPEQTADTTMKTELNFHSSSL